CRGWPLTAYTRLHQRHTDSRWRSRVVAPASFEPSELPRGPFPVRQRLVALVVVQFVVFVGLLTVLGLWPADAGGRGFVLLLLILMTLVLPVALALIAAPIVHHVE